MGVPDMRHEIIDAVHMMYEDDPHFEADCYLYLSNLHLDRKVTQCLSSLAEDRLDKMGRCRRCGTILEPFCFREKHYELESEPVEEVVEWYCPNCDIGIKGDVID